MLNKNLKNNPCTNTSGLNLPPIGTVLRYLIGSDGIITLFPFLQLVVAKTASTIKSRYFDTKYVVPNGVRSDGSANLITQSRKIPVSQIAEVANCARSLYARDGVYCLPYKGMDHKRLLPLL